MKLKKITSIILASLFSITLIACGEEKDKESTSDNNTNIEENVNDERDSAKENSDNSKSGTDMNKKNSKNTAVDTNKNNKSNNKVTSSQLNGVEDKKEIKLEVTGLDKNYNPDFRTPWIESGRYKACLAGKGEYNGEEGYARLYLTDMKMDVGACRKIEYSEWNKEQKTILKIKFVNNSSGFQEVAIMVGSAHGTLAKGGDLYIYNPSTDTVYRAYKCGDREQVVNVKQNGNGNIIIEVIKYDENYMNYDTLTKKIKLS